jgi:gas vesicle protein
MTEEKFEQIKDIKEEIEEKEKEIRSISSLLSSCGISCKITGTPKGTSKQVSEFYFYNKEEIVRILKLSMEKIANELNKLKKEFSEL